MRAWCGWAKHITADSGRVVLIAFAILVLIVILGLRREQELQFSQLILIAEDFARATLLPLSTGVIKTAPGRTQWLASVQPAQV